MTNGDRIRNMTDEALAEFLAKIEEPMHGEEIIIGGGHFLAEDKI